MCANSPKDYTHPGQKRAVAQQVHNGVPLVQDDRTGWYRRVENNGWRLLSGKVDKSSDNMLLVPHCMSDHKIKNVPEGMLTEMDFFNAQDLNPGPEEPLNVHILVFILLLKHLLQQIG